jgi:uncharacterized protein (TIGR03067 family)
MKMGGGESVLVLDPRRKPAWLDVQRSSSGSVQMRGIYELEGNVLRFCYFTGRGDRLRPDSIDPVPEGATLVILERVPAER